MNKQYEVLNLFPGASKADIRKNYLKLSLKYHPDKNSSPNAIEMMSKLNEAYGALYYDQNDDIYSKQKSSHTMPKTRDKFRQFMKTPYEYNYLYCENLVELILEEIKNKLLEVSESSMSGNMKVTKIKTWYNIIKKIGQFSQYMISRGFTDINSNLEAINNLIFNACKNADNISLTDFDENGFYKQNEEQYINLQLYSDINQYLPPSKSSINSTYLLLAENIKKYIPSYDITDTTFINVSQIKMENNECWYTTSEIENLHNTKKLIENYAYEKIKYILNNYGIFVDEQLVIENRILINKILFNYKNLT